MGKTNRRILLALLVLVSFIETVFIGCGSSGDSDFYNPVGYSSQSDVQTSFYQSSSTRASEQGTFYIASSKSNFIAQAIENGTVKANTNITLVERNLTPAETQTFGNSTTRIYKLIATDDNTTFGKAQSINTAAKPIKLIFSQHFPENTENVYLATRASNEEKWQITKIDISNSNRAAIGARKADTYYNFSIDVFNLNQDITVFGTTTESNLVSNVLRDLAVNRLKYSFEPANVNLKLDAAGELQYDSDIVINTCVDSNVSDFSSFHTKTVITFLSDNPRTIGGLKGVGLTTENLAETVSATRDGADNKYTHTVTFTRYRTPTTVGNIATYTFTLQLKGVKFSDFPSNFRIKTVLTTITDISYTSEQNFELGNTMACLIPLTPIHDEAYVKLDQILTLRCIAHNVASVTVFYDHAGLVGGYREWDGDFTFNKEAERLVFTPANYWPADKHLSVAVYAQCCDAHGQEGLKKAIFEFFTATYTPELEQITSAVEVPDQTADVPINTKIVFNFSDDIAWSNSEVDKSYFQFYLDHSEITNTLTSFEYATTTKALTIIPSPLQYNATYTINLKGGLKNRLTGQKISPASFTFRTEDTMHLTASATLDVASDVDGLAILTPTINIEFMQPVKDKAEAEKALEFYCGTMRNTGYKFKWSVDQSSVALIWTATLKANTEYTLKMKNSIEDENGIIIEPFEDFIITTLPNITASMTSPAVTNADVNSLIVLKFSDSLTWDEELDARRIQVKKGGVEAEIADYSYFEPEQTLTITPASNFEHNATYSVTIFTNLLNRTTRQAVATATFIFTTSDGIRETASIAATPESVIDGQLILKPTFKVTFNKPVLGTDKNKALKAIKVLKGTTQITKLYKNFNSTLDEITITFAEPLEHATDYKITMENGIKDLESTYINPFDDYEFTTLNRITVILDTPAATANVATSTAIILGFDVQIDWKAEYNSYVTFRSGDTDILVSRVEYDETSNTLAVYPSSKLRYNSSYTLIVREGLMNDTTNQRTAGTTFSFSTESGNSVQATLTTKPEDKIGDLYTVFPSFEVDFGKTVSDYDAAIDSIKLFYENQEHKSLVKTWLVRGRKLKVTTSNILRPNMTYVLSMKTEVLDKEGIPITPFTNFEFTTTDNGSGTEENPYHIYTPDHLNLVRMKLEAFYIVMNDIDMTGYDFSPIGDNKESFTGGFDGNGFTISNLSINEAATDSVALLGRIADAKVKNVIMANGTITGNNSVGSIVGYSYHSNITNCVNESVNVFGASHVGGICGSSYSTYITFCRNNGSVNSYVERAGGICGWGKNPSNISSCKNTGTISSDHDNAGGITGYSNGRIDNCINEGSVTAEENAGGIAGFNSLSAKIDRCIATGNITAISTASRSFGGIAGLNEGSAYVCNNVITNNTILNGVGCSIGKEAIGNYETGYDNYKNYCFTSIADFNRAFQDQGYWTDDQEWSKKIWQLSFSAWPTLIGLP